MVDVRVQIPNVLMDKFKTALGDDAKATDIAKDALTLYNWAVQQRLRGLNVTSSDDAGQPKFQLALSSLDNITPAVQTVKAGSNDTV